MKLLFVCMGNICRSPAAHGVMENLVRQENLTGKISCDSAGTIGYHQGSLPDARMREHAKKRGLNLDHLSRKFAPSDFEDFDYILVMDHDNYHDVVSQDVHKKYGGKIHYLTDFCQKMKASEVPDPYYGGANGFELVLDLVTDACEGLLLKIKKEL